MSLETIEHDGENEFGMTAFEQNAPVIGVFGIIAGPKAVQRFRRVVTRKFVLEFVVSGLALKIDSIRKKKKVIFFFYSLRYIKSEDLL